MLVAADGCVDLSCLSDLQQITGDNILVKCWLRKKKKKNTKISKRHKPTCKERAREGVLLDDGQEREGRRKRQKRDAAVGWRFVLQPVMQDRGHCMVLGIFGRKEWSMLCLLRYVLLVVHLWVLAI